MGGQAYLSLVRHFYKHMLDFFKGKKTYIVSGFIIIAATAFGLGFITKEQFEMIIAILAGMGGIALRAAVK